MAEQTWKTYAEAAALLGLSVEGVRQRARREHWRKQLANTGKAMVMIPEDTTRPPADDAPGHQSDARLATTRAPAARTPGEVEALQARVAELKVDLDRERAEREREHSERVQERDRADRLSQELADTTRRLVGLVEEMRELAAIRERLAASELRSTEAHERHVGELRDLRARLEGDAGRARDELASFRARPWWRRIAG